jgi:integrase
MATWVMRVRDIEGHWRDIPAKKRDAFRKKPGEQVAWLVKIRMKGYPPQVETFERKTDAKRWVQETESAIRSGRHFLPNEGKRRTVADLIDRYTRDVLPTKKDGDKQGRQLTWWRDAMGVYLLKDVTPALIAEMRDKFAAEPGRGGKLRSPATVNRYLAVLSHAFTVASREYGWTEDNPVKRVRRGKESNGRVRWLDDDERARLLAACREATATYLYPIVVLALSTGMRRGEILKLRWKEVDLSRGLIVLHDTKNGDRRGVALVGHALDVMKDWAKVRQLGSDLVFPGTTNAFRPWERALKRAEIEDFRFHDLRHSAASYLAMNGATQSEIAAVLGHKTLSMVKRYAHLSDAHVRGVVASMNEGIFGGEA